MMLTIVKIGGNVLDDEQLLETALRDFSLISGPKILVHGGGKMASRLAESLGVTPEFHNGRRITTAQMLDIALMSYAGVTNKKVVAKLQSLAINALGFSGADANLILSEKRNPDPVDFGFVGDVKQIDGGLLSKLMQLGITPVFCAITHDGNGNLLNTNADTIAAELAISMSQSAEVKLLYCFEKPGVLKDANDEASVLTALSHREYEHLVESGSVHSGMLPKLENCFRALANGVAQVRIGDTGMLTDAGPGTKIHID